MTSPDLDDRRDLYDEISPFYHLIFADWNSSIERQATALDSIIKEFWGTRVKTINRPCLWDRNTTIGLAQLGYEMTASDLSPAAIERAGRDVAARSLVVGLSVADIREASAHHQKQFDLVIACDNSVPHLLKKSSLLMLFNIGPKWMTSGFMSLS